MIHLQKCADDAVCSPVIYRQTGHHYHGNVAQGILVSHLTVKHDARFARQPNVQGHQIRPPHLCFFQGLPAVVGYRCHQPLPWQQSGQQICEIRIVLDDQSRPGL